VGIWKALKDTLKEVAEKTIPKKEKKNESTRMSQDTLRVVEHGRQMKTEGNWAQVRKLNGEIQKRIRKDKENYLKEKCKMLKEHNKRGRTRDLYQQIREITGNPKINTGSIQSRAGIDYIEKDKIIRRWKEYTEELYKKDTKTNTEVHEKRAHKNHR
jgi:hypothetical protein